MWPLYTAVILGCIFVKSLSANSVFEVVPKNQDVYQGRVAILQCALKDEWKSSYKLVWRTDGKDVEDGRRHIGADGHLRFDSVDKDLDSGPFQCIAINQLNPDKEEVTDSVALNIKWLDINGVVQLAPDGDGDILPGDKIMLGCNVTGKPRPQMKSIFWQFNGADVRNETALDVVVSRGKLVIKQAKLKSYDGEYTCCVPAGTVNRCSISSFTLIVRDKTIPVIVEPPDDVTVRQNDTAKFHCKFDAVPAPRIEWYHDGDLLKLKQTEKCRICGYDNGTLIVTMVKARFVGMYKCKATAENGHSASAQAKLSLAHIENFKDPFPEEEFVDDGSVIEKLCLPPGGDPPPSIKWIKDNVQIPVSGRGTHDQVTVSGGTLIIESMRKSDEGAYQCVARNMAGFVNKTFIFRIKLRPIIRSGLVSRTEDEGTTAILICKANGAPDPDYYWYRNETLLKSNKKFEIKGNQLTILNISLEDAAEYKCIAQNVLGKATSVASISIKERLKFDPLPVDVCAEASKPTRIPCGARGITRPTVSWNVAPKSDKYEIIEHSPSNKTLLINNPQTGDNWKAYCTAGSAQVDAEVDAISKDITITVGRRPNIVKPPANASVFKGQSVRLDCGIDPDSEMNLRKVHWMIHYANGSVTEYTVKSNSNSERYVLMNNGSFYVKNANMADSGTYTCHYEDCGFVVSATADLDVAEIEGPITTSSDSWDDLNADSTPQYKKIQTVALATGCSVAYLILTITIIVYCRRKKRHKKNKANNSHGVVEEGGEEEEALMINGLPKCSNGSGVQKQYDQVELGPVNHLSDGIKKLQYDHSKLELVTEIGQGDFGKVYLSKAPGLLPDLADDVLVMVKKLEQTVTEENDSMKRSFVEGRQSKRAGFNREIRLLHMADHENIGKLLGVCSEKENSVLYNYLITEYLEWGILKLCLQASSDGKLQRLSKFTKMKMCCQIAAGLEHLTNLGLSHQDVATRNCIVSSKLLVKLSVLNLTKDGFENEYSMHNGRLMPVRWMAPEVHHDHCFKLKSDIWSFGVTCWEIFTLGTMPFSDLSDDDFLKGMRSDSPPTLPALDGSKRMTSLISKCCQRNRTRRPEFYQIVKKLQSILSMESKSQHMLREEENTNSDDRLQSTIG